MEPYLVDQENNSSTTVSESKREEGYISDPEIRKENQFDHPLSVQPKSTWNKFFNDLELWEEIEKDVRRTRSDITFFIEAVDSTKNQNKE